MARWTWWDWSLSLGLLLPSLDTVGWVIWPVKPVPDITYNVFSGMLNPTQSINHAKFHPHGYNAPCGVKNLKIAQCHLVVYRCLWDTRTASTKAEDKTTRAQDQPSIDDVGSCASWCCRRNHIDCRREQWGAWYNAAICWCGQYHSLTGPTSLCLDSFLYAWVGF